VSTERIDVEALRGHTPGPWKWWDSCSFRRLSHEGDGDVLAPVVQQSDGHPDVHFRNGGYTGPDARLIAAAPALLAEVIERRARDAAVAELVKHAHTAAARLWGSDDYHDRMAGDSLSDALAAVQGAQP